MEPDDFLDELELFFVDEEPSLEPDFFVSDALLVDDLVVLLFVVVELAVFSAQDVKNATLARSATAEIRDRFMVGGCFD